MSVDLRQVMRAAIFIMRLQRYAKSVISYFKAVHLLLTSHWKDNENFVTKGSVEIRSMD
jgi:hypothetical protein